MKEEIKTFDEYCRDFIEDHLPGFEGRTYDAGDIFIYITDGINADGTVTYSTQLALDYLREWSYEAGRYFDYEKDNFGEHYVNPFDRPEAYMVCMIIEGVRDILCQCDYIDKHWNEDITLTEDIIDTIINQAKEMDVSWAE